MSSSSKKTASAGNKGESVRSDCFVTITLNHQGGLQIDLQSKVEAMYGESIRTLITEILDHFKIHHATVSIEDSGALPFVIAARMEAAIKNIMETYKEYLPEMK